MQYARGNMLPRECRKATRRHRSGCVTLIILYPEHTNRFHIYTLYCFMVSSVWPRCIYPFHVVTYYKKWVTTSWTYSIFHGNGELEKLRTESKGKWMEREKIFHKPLGIHFSTEKWWNWIWKLLKMCDYCYVFIYL